MRFYLLLPLLLLALDRFTKQLALTRGQFTANPGWFFFNLPLAVFILLALSALFLLIHQSILAYRHHRPWLLIALLLILAGGLSNLYDRLLFGFVIDWIHLTILPFSVFNLADAIIFLGTGLLLLKL